MFGASGNSYFCLYFSRRPWSKLWIYLLSEFPRRVLESEVSMLINPLFTISQLWLLWEHWAQVTLWVLTTSPIFWDFFLFPFLFFQPVSEVFSEDIQWLTTLWFGFNAPSSAGCFFPRTIWFDPMSEGR
jgi:hypothetical protein